MESNSGDWRSEMTPEMRKRVLQMILDCLKKNLPVTGDRGLDELKRIAVKYEEKMYSRSTRKEEYIWKISYKLNEMDTRNKGTTAVNRSHPNPIVGYQSSSHSGFLDSPPGLAGAVDLQEEIHQKRIGNATTMKMKRDITATCRYYTSELESTEKGQKSEADHALAEEILEINQRLFYVVASIINKDEGSFATLTRSGARTMVKLSFSLLTLSPNFRLKFISGLLSPIVSLRLLIPTDYPKCSPIIVDKLQLEASHESEVLSVKAQSVFDRSTRCLVQPFSLREIATMWDKCICKAITEYAEQNGGGSFSTGYGVWESCVPV